MNSFTYTIKDELGIHARLAGMLAKTAKAIDIDMKVRDAVRKTDISK